MIKIYICDDEQLWIDKARSIIAEYFDNRLETELDHFDSAAALLKVLIDNKEYADIVILDIDMPKLTGFDAAERIRAAYPDVLLLFYTSHEQYVFESFRFQPFRYIRKQYAQKELKLALSAAEDVLSKRMSRSVILKTKDESLMVNVDDIMYFGTVRRRIDVHLKGGRVLNVGLSLKELIRQIDSPGFIMILSGVVVNVRYIKTYSGNEITLENGVRLNVSRGRMSEVKSAVMKYWSARL